MFKMFKTLSLVDGHSVDVQYSNWKNNEPGTTTHDCVVVTGNNEWMTWNCEDSQKYVCQSQ